MFQPVMRGQMHTLLIDNKIRVQWLKRTKFILNISKHQKQYSATHANHSRVHLNPILIIFDNVPKQLFDQLEQPKQHILKSNHGDHILLVNPFSDIDDLDVFNGVQNAVSQQEIRENVLEGAFGGVILFLVKNDKSFEDFNDANAQAKTEDVQICKSRVFKGETHE